MNYKNIIQICFVFFIISHIVSGQTTGQKYEKYKLQLKTGDEIIVEKGFMTDSTVVDVSNSREKKFFSTKDINAIDYSTGKQTVKGALFFAGIGAATSALCCVVFGHPQEIYSTDFYTGRQTLISGKPITSEEFAEVVAISTVVSGLVGAIVGSLHDKWENIPISTSVKTSLKGNYQFGIRINL